MRKCARAIIFNEQHRLLVFERERQHGLFQKLHRYYSIPGGGMEPGETPEQAVVRELREEMLVDIVPEILLIHQIDEPDGRENFYFLAHIVTGSPIFNLASEEAVRSRPFLKNTYKIAWSDLDDPLLAYYESYAQVAAQLKAWLDVDKFSDTTVDMRIKSR